MPIILQTPFFRRKFEATPEVVKERYETFANGSNNIAREDKPLYYYSHCVLSGLTYQEFLNIIKED